jgi:hypothetical protein
MRQRIIDLRHDGATAAQVSQALQLQAQYGYQYASEHLQALGVDAHLVQRLLAIRYERRSLQAVSQPELVDAAQLVA